MTELQWQDVPTVPPADVPLTIRKCVLDSVTAVVSSFADRIELDVFLMRGKKRWQVLHEGYPNSSVGVVMDYAQVCLNALAAAHPKRPNRAKSKKPKVAKEAA